MSRYNYTIHIKLNRWQEYELTGYVLADDEEDAKITATNFAIASVRKHQLEALEKRINRAQTEIISFEAQ